MDFGREEKFFKQKVQSKAFFENFVNFLEKMTYFQPEKQIT
jgi:hypothetical protein